MPGVQRIPERKLASEIERYARAGIKSVMTFGVSHHLDANGSDTWREDGLVSRMSRIAKDAVPEMIVMSDTCFCEYTDHGHCGVMHNHEVDNDQTLINLGKQAVAAARAGADVIAPSAAMDGQVRAIRPGARRRRLHADSDHGLLDQIRFGTLRPVPRGWRQRAQGRSQKLSDEPDEPPRSPARIAAR